VYNLFHPIVELVSLKFLLCDVQVRGKELGISREDLSHMVGASESASDRKLPTNREIDPLFGLPSYRLLWHGAASGNLRVLQGS
jgi:hypothetical protein